MLKKLLVLTAILALALVASPAMAASHATGSSDATVTLTILDYCAVAVADFGITIAAGDYTGPIGTKTVSAAYTITANTSVTVTTDITGPDSVGADGIPLTGDDFPIYSETGPSNTTIGPGVFAAESVSVTATVHVNDGQNVSDGTLTVTCTP